MTLQDSNAGVQGQLQAILDAIADGVVVIDHDGLICFANPAAGELLQRPKHDLLGTPFGFPTRAGESIEINLEQTGAFPRAAEMRVAEVPWDGGTAFLASLRDVTERNQADSMRAALVHEQAARKEAETGIRERDDFVTVLNHELRTPLTRLRLWIHRAKRQVEQGANPDEAHESLEQADVETELLSRLMAQFMEVSQLEQGRRELNPAPLDLTQIVRRIVDREQARSPRYELRTQLPSDPLVAMVDPNAIEQIVANTLSYAMRNAAEQPVDIELARDSSVARLAVRHRGRAMVEDRERPLFGQSFAAHASGYASGIGVWLYVSRKLAEMHGGDVTVEMPEDGGTRIIISVPVGVDDPGGAS